MQLKRTNKTTVIYIVAAVVLLVAIGAAGLFAKKYYDLKANPNQASQEDTKKITDKVGKLYQLPKDETPILGKVKDKEKLKDQAFFKDSQNGDDLLIYQKARVAVIYRDGENKLINVGPIAIDAANNQNGQTAAATVKVLNGGGRTGAAADATKKIGEVAGLKVDGQPGEAKTKVQKTVVVDVNGNKAEAAKQLAEKVGGSVGSLPAGESKPSTDLLVIVGAQ